MVNKQLRDFHRERIAKLLKNLGESTGDAEKHLQAVTGLLQVISTCINDLLDELDKADNDCSKQNTS